MSLRIPLVTNRAKEVFDHAMQWIAEEDFESAIGELTRAIFLNEIEPHYWVTRAKCYAKLSDIKSCIADFRKAISLCPNDDYVLVDFVTYLDLLGCIYYSERRFSQAVHLFNEGIQLKSNQSVLYFHRALAFYALNDISQALEDLLVCDAAIPEAHVLRATIFLRKFNNLSYAQKECEIAKSKGCVGVKKLERDITAELESINQKTTELLVAERYKDASMLVEKIIEAFPDDKNLLMVRSTCFRKLNLYPAALKDLFKIIKMSGCKHPEAEQQVGVILFDLAKNLESQGLLAEAIRYFSEALKWCNTPLLLISRGDCYYKIKQYESAMRDYETALSLKLKQPNSPKFDLVFSRLALFYAEQATAMLQYKILYPEAEKLFGRAIQLTPQNVNLYLYRFKVRALLKKADDCICDLLIAFLLEPQNEQVHQIILQHVPQIIYDAEFRKSAMKRFDITEDGVRNAQPVFETPKLETPPLSSRNYSLFDEYMDRMEKDPAHKMAMESLSPTKTILSSLRSTPVRLKLSPSPATSSHQSTPTPFIQHQPHKMLFKGKYKSSFKISTKEEPKMKRSRSVLGLTPVTKENPTSPSIPSVLLPITLPKLHATKLTPRRELDSQHIPRYNSLDNLRKNTVTKKVLTKPSISTFQDKKDQLSSWNTKNSGSESLATTQDITTYVNLAKE